MTDEEAREKALEDLKRLLPYMAAPQLSDADLDALLDKAKRASTWEAATAYVHGDLVQPTVGNGLHYKCIQSGTSGATEPIWPTGQASVVDDGAGETIARWQEDGPAYKQIYNVRKAAHEGWMMKAGKAALSVDMSGPVGNISGSQIQKQCLEMAKSFGSIEIA